MKNKKIISLTAVSLVLGSTIATSNASNGMAATRELQVPAGVSMKIPQAEQTAIDNGDYNAWKAAIESSGNTDILNYVTEENFARYVEAFKLRESGDMDGSKAILDELGIKMPGPKGKGGERMMESVSQENREALENAIKNADYGAWKNIMEEIKDEKIADYISEENFNVIVRAYKLRSSGDNAGATKLLKNSNIPGFMCLCGGPIRDNEVWNQEALMQTYENNDYNAWKTLMEERGGGKILELVNADNFAKFAQAKVLQSKGKAAEARAIMDELGFPFQERGVRRGQFANAATAS